MAVNTNIINEDITLIDKLYDGVINSSSGTSSDYSKTINILIPPSTIETPLKLTLDSCFSSIKKNMSDTVAYGYLTSLMKDIVVSNSYNSSEKSVFGNALFSFPSTKYLLKDIINEYFSMNIRDIS